ncbi:DUF6243 family protein [Streptomyces sp. NBC_01795]|uniref:DUF6243 family protein n=1 Tax=unclassified Streptomyces TaxID=2593676 RepID=UPI002DDBE9B4|nr:MULTISPECIES: DUF6243 family protein [unclassified Streptomyces]WSA95082.1 DUF6243 family protein [Streptomyces sp. NBC_01795]WSS12293.1 DUF6243 family protein [Streptomyces sp. NBC_01186]
MGKGRDGNALGVGGTRSRKSRKALRGGKQDNGYGPGGTADPAAQKRELLRKLRESRE